jgi:hypothetical protein
VEASKIEHRQLHPQLTILIVATRNQSIAALLLSTRALSLSLSSQ